MTVRSAVCPGLAGLVWLVLVQACFAQYRQTPLIEPNQSHKPIDTTISDPKVAAQLLAERLGRARDRSEIDKLLLNLAQEIARNPEKYGFKDQVEKLLKEKASPDLNDPKWRELLSKLLDSNTHPEMSNPDLIPPDKREAWKKFLDQTAPTDPPKPIIPPRPDQPKPDQPGPGPKSIDPNPHQARPTPTPPPQEGPTPREQESRARFSKWLTEAAERLQKSGALRDSPAAKQFGTDIARLLGNNSEKGLGLTDKAGQWVAQLPPLGKYIPTDRLPRPEFPKLGSAWLDKLSSLHWDPVTSSGSPEAHWSESVPAVSAPAVSGGGELLQGLLIIVGLAGLVVAVVVLWRWRSGQSGREAVAWKLGPWPVNPALVKTREEVVKAFEYLSLLRLGMAARTWHHRQIANQLAEPETAVRRPAVERVAGTYEQARYAPPSETLSENALAAVRRDLCDLAGVSAP